MRHSREVSSASRWEAEFSTSEFANVERYARTAKHARPCAQSLQREHRRHEGARSQRNEPSAHAPMREVNHGAPGVALTAGAALAARNPENGEA
jgi:hypothetical protein